MATAAKPNAAGGIYVAATGSTLPTTADATLGSDFKSLGYVTDAGLKRNINHETEEVKDWSGSTVLVLDKGKTETFTFALMDVTNVDVMKLVYGDSNVTGTLSTGITANSGAARLGGHAYVVDMILENNVAQRIVIPNGVVSEIGEITYAGESAVSYELTITALADSSNNTAYEYLKG